jgi:hypothetical protein
MKKQHQNQVDFFNSVVTLLTEETTNFSLFFFSPLEILEFELSTSHFLGSYSTTRATPPALFCAGYFQDRVQTTVLLISASQVARIPGNYNRSHRDRNFLKTFNKVTSQDPCCQAASHDPIWVMD